MLPEYVEVPQPSIMIVCMATGGSYVLRTKAYR